MRAVLTRLASTDIRTGLDGVRSSRPSQLLERLGFASAQLSTPVQGPVRWRSSGGCSCCCSCSSEPNVLLLDEPTNDLDTDMLRRAWRTCWTPGRAR